jgi:hypothetical protein
MEPVYMILGQSAATAAVLAIEDNVSVQDVDRKKLRERLDSDTQVVESFATKLIPGYQHWMISVAMLTLFQLA